MRQFLMCANSSAHKLDGIPGRMLCWERAPLENLFYVPYASECCQLPCSRSPAWAVLSLGDFSSGHGEHQPCSMKKVLLSTGE